MIASLFYSEENWNTFQALTPVEILATMLFVQIKFFNVQNILMIGKSSSTVVFGTITCEICEH